jgi:hypothetical protein
MAQHTVNIVLCRKELALVEWMVESDVHTKNSRLTVATCGQPEAHTWGAIHLLYCREIPVGKLAMLVFVSTAGLPRHRQCTYPLVKTFNSDVLPHAPSPLCIAH